MRGEGLRTIAREVAALRREGRRLCQSLEEEENVLEVMVEQMARERTYRAGSSKEIDSWLREPRLIRKNGAWVRLPSRGLRVIELDFRPLSGLLTAFQFLPVKIDPGRCSLHGKDTHNIHRVVADLASALLDGRQVSKLTGLHESSGRATGDKTLAEARLDILRCLYVPVAESLSKRAEWIRATATGNPKSDAQGWIETAEGCEEVALCLLDAHALLSEVGRRGKSGADAVLDSRSSILAAGTNWWSICNQMLHLSSSCDRSPSLSLIGKALADATHQLVGSPFAKSINGEKSGLSLAYTATLADQRDVLITPVTSKAYRPVSAGSRGGHRRHHGKSVDSRENEEGDSEESEDEQSSNSEPDTSSHDDQMEHGDTGGKRTPPANSLTSLVFSSLFTSQDATSSSIQETGSSALLPKAYEILYGERKRDTEDTSSKFSHRDRKPRGGSPASSSCCCGPAPSLSGAAQRWSKMSKLKSSQDIMASLNNVGSSVLLTLACSRSQEVPLLTLLHILPVVALRPEIPSKTVASLALHCLQLAATVPTSDDVPCDVPVLPWHRGLRSCEGGREEKEGKEKDRETELRDVRRALRGLSHPSLSDLTSGFRIDVVEEMLTVPAISISSCAEYLSFLLLLHRCPSPHPPSITAVDQRLIAVANPALLPPPSTSTVPLQDMISVVEDLHSRGVLPRVSCLAVLLLLRIQAVFAGVLQGEDEGGGEEENTASQSRKRQRIEGDGKGIRMADGWKGSESYVSDVLSGLWQSWRESDEYSVLSASATSTASKSGRSARTERSPMSKTPSSARKGGKGREERQKKTPAHNGLTSLASLTSPSRPSSSSQKTPKSEIKKEKKKQSSPNAKERSSSDPKQLSNSTSTSSTLELQLSSSPSSRILVLLVRLLSNAPQLPHRLLFVLPLASFSHYTHPLLLRALFTQDAFMSLAQLPRLLHLRVTLLAARAQGTPSAVTLPPLQLSNKVAPALAYGLSRLYHLVESCGVASLRDEAATLNDWATALLSPFLSPSLVENLKESSTRASWLETSPFQSQAGVRLAATGVLLWSATMVVKGVRKTENKKKNDSSQLSPLHEALGSVDFLLGFYQVIGLCCDMAAVMLRRLSTSSTADSDGTAACSAKVVGAVSGLWCFLLAIPDIMASCAMIDKLAHARPADLVTAEYELLASIEHIVLRCRDVVRSGVSHFDTLVAACSIASVMPPSFVALSRKHGVARRSTRPKNTNTSDRKSGHEKKPNIQSPKGGRRLSRRQAPPRPPRATATSSSGNPILDSWRSEEKGRDRYEDLVDFIV